jgi:solute carrier family 25 (mitochondrial aspartate/glutamate transporter), member 12/13
MFFIIRLARWRLVIDSRLREQRFLDRDNFVNAIAPTGDLTKIGRAQFAILFRVADTSKRGLVSWSDFTVFETLLKRPDADYWMAFEYFDVCVCIVWKLWRIVSNLL